MREETEKKSKDLLVRERARRRSPIVEREAAKALDASALIPSEPVTVIISEKGWVRAGKGHELDPNGLQYKGGDAFLHAAKGRSNQLAVFIDTTGRTYALPAHELPSAKGHGEPLSSSLTPPPGAAFVGVMMGEPDDLWLMSTDDGYGFVVRLARDGRSRLNAYTLSGRKTEVSQARIAVRM